MGCGRSAAAVERRAASGAGGDVEHDGAGRRLDLGGVVPCAWRRSARADSSVGARIPQLIKNSHTLCVGLSLQFFLLSLIGYATLSRRRLNLQERQLLSVHPRPISRSRSCGTQQFLALRERWDTVRRALNAAAPADPAGRSTLPASANFGSTDIAVALCSRRADRSRLCRQRRRIRREGRS